MLKGKALVTDINEYRALKAAERLHKAINELKTHGDDPVDVSFKLDPIPEYL